MYCLYDCILVVTHVSLEKLTLVHISRSVFVPASPAVILNYLMLSKICL